MGKKPRTAKKVPARAEAAETRTTDDTLASGFIKSAGYSLTVTNDTSSGTDFDIRVDGEDGEEYNLQVTNLSDRTALVQATFDRIGVLWPAFDFEFRADAANRIIEVR